jgi:hypothetical protein
MTRKGPGRDVRKERRWRRLIGEAARSGLSVREFCQRKGLEECQFYSWRREIKRRRDHRQGRNSRADLASFALVSADGDEEAAGIELVLEGGRKLRIRRGVDAETLRTVMGALAEQATC